MKKIPLTKGKYAIVDDEDFPYMNRFVWQLMEGSDRAVRTIKVKNEHICMPMEYLLIKNKKKHLIYHKNKNTLDNRKENLALLSIGATLHASTKRKTHGGKQCTSAYKGVSWNKNSKKWETRIYWNKQKYYCGAFESEKEAGKAYNKKAKEIYGDLAYQNKID